MNNFEVCMKINSVKQFVQNNIIRFEKTTSGRNCSLNLYDKNNVWRGEHTFKPIKSSDYLGVGSSVSNTRIMSKDLKLEMQ